MMNKATHTQLWACMYRLSHTQRRLFHPEATVPMRQDTSQQSSATNKLSCLIFIRNMKHTKPAPVCCVHGRKPQAALVSNCCDPAVSRNNHERLQQCRFIQQKASDVGFHSTARSRPQLSGRGLAASGASVARSNVFAQKKRKKCKKCVPKCDFYIRCESTCVSCSCFRVINAGKSALNEDQACCEVVVARRRPMSYCPPSTPSKTPTAKRRNSLPNGEGLGLRMEHGRLGEVRRDTQTHTLLSVEVYAQRVCHVHA